MILLEKETQQKYSFIRKGFAFVALMGIFLPNASLEYIVPKALNLYQTTFAEAGETLTTGLINWYKFNDGGGTTAIDSLAPAINATLTNGPTWSTDVPGNTSSPNPNGYSVLFDGTNDYVVSANSPGLPTGDFTYSAWIKPTNTDAADKTILMAASAGGNEFAIYRNAALNITVWTNNVSRITSTKKPSAGSWSHITVTRSGTSLKLYIDGVLDTTVTDSSGVLSFTTCPLLIGVDADASCTGTLAEYWKGNIDDVRVYNTALSLTDIQSIYNNAFLTTAPGGISSNLKLWLRADMGTSITTDGGAVSGWKDQSNSANDAIQNTVASRPTFQNDSTSLINFNPVVNTTGNQYLYTSGVPAANMNVYAVGRRGPGGASWATLLRGQTVDHPIIVQVSNNALGYYDGTSSSNKTSGFTQTNGEVSLLGLFSRTTGTQGWNAKNGKNGTIYTTIADTHIGNFYSIGNYQSGGQPYGDLAELIYVSDASHSELARRKVESYLGTKYAITLDQTTPTSYLASDCTNTGCTTGTKIWDESVGGLMRNNITIIGRDDTSLLNQKQSKSTNTIVGNSLITLALGSSIATSNETNANTFSADKTFLSLADDNGAIGSWSTTGAPANYRVIARKWKVQEVGTVGNVTLSIPDNSSTLGTKLPPEAAVVYLLTDADGDFTAGSTSIPMTYNSTAKEWRVTTDINHTQFFTFATNPQPGPGGITNGLQQWLRADIGTNVNVSNNFTTTGGTPWADQGPNARDVNFVNSDPQLVQNSMNYNPATVFDGDDWMRIDGGNATFYNGWTAGNQFSVVKSYDTVGTRAWPYYIGGGAFGHHYTWSNGYIYTGYGSTARKAWHPTTLAVAEGGGTTTATYTVDVKTPHIMDQESATNNWKTSFDGRVQYQTTTNTVRFNSADGNAHYGAYPGSGNWYGEASEYSTYNRVLAGYEKQRVNSYMAAKYGITLNQNSATDYFASDCSDTTCSTGTKMWNATTANVSGTKYDDDITVIGRDDSSLLSQKQSKSVNTSALVAVSNGTSFAGNNEANTNAFTNNHSYLSLASESSNATAWTTTGAPTDRRILNRKFQAQETGTVGQVRIQIPDDSSTLTSKLPIESRVVYLLTKISNADFSTGATEVVMTKVGTNWETTIDMPVGVSYFTVATELPPSPGGVSQPTLSALINGVQFSRYEGYDGNLADGINATLIQRGYIGTLLNPDDSFLNDDSDTFTFEFQTQINITNAGVYEFQIQALDDAGYLAIDGIQKISTVGGSPTSGNVTLSAGWHTITLRHSENGGVETVNLFWRGTTVGLDTGTAFTTIPDSKLYTTISGPSSWHKADAGINVTDGQTPTSWQDSSQNGNDLTTAVGTPLYYTTNNSHLKNFNPSILFGDDQMETLDHGQGYAFGKQGKTIITALTKTLYNGGNGRVTALGQDNCNNCSFNQFIGADAASADAWNSTITQTGFFGSLENDKPKIYGTQYANGNITTTNNVIVTNDGKIGVKGTQTAWQVNANDGEDMSIGSHNDNATDGHDGKIMEVVYFPWDLSPLERQRVDSYMASKYGITLSSDNDGDAVLNETLTGSIKEGDYVASNGTTQYFSTTIAGNFKNDIIVIGRDDQTALDQRQSKSVNGDDPLTVSLDSTVATNNESVIGTFASNRSYVAISNDDADSAITYNLNGNFNAHNVNSISDRAWKVQRTNSSETITLSVPSTQVFGNGNQRKLIVSSDGVFDGVGESVYTMNANGAYYSTTLTSAELPNGATFVLAGRISAPGGVTGVSSGDGTVGNPFQSLYEAYSTVTVAGTYYFNIQGNTFSSYVDANGWVLVASSDGSAAGAYTQTSTMTLSSDRILTSGITQVLDVTSLRMNSTSGTAIDVTTSDNTPISRLKAFTSLGYQTGENGVWSGTNVAGLAANCNGGSLALSSKIWHSCGLGSNLHWIPSTNSAGFANAANDTSMHLWARSTQKPFTLWLKADQNTSCTASGCSLTAWNDSSLQSSAGVAYNNPTIVTGQHNYNPTVRFNGTNQYIDMADGYANFTAGVSIFTIAKPTTNGSFARFMDFGNGQTNNNILFSRNATSANITFESYNATIGGQINTNNSPIVNSIDNLYSAFQTPGIANTTIRKNAALQSTVTSVSSLPQVVTRTLNYIGRSNWAADAYYAGDIPELIMYQKNLSVSDRQRVDSYLAVKYGLTLDQTVATHYVASDWNGTTGTKIWDALTTGAYRNDITVIGRDDNGSLDQRQSKSQTPTGLVAVGLGTLAATNQDNPNAFASDKIFMSFASESTGSLSWQNIYNGSKAPDNRQLLNRVWKVQETGNIGSVKFQVPDDSSTLTSKLPSEGITGQQVYLLVDSDADFSEGATEYVLTLNGTNWETDIDLSNGQYFTIASDITQISPGGVSTNLQLWLRADMNGAGFDPSIGTTTDGATLTSWDNKTGIAQPTITLGTPSYENDSTNNINFNPTVYQNGTEHYTYANNMGLTGIGVTSIATTKLLGNSPSYPTNAIVGPSVASAGQFAMFYVNAGTNGQPMNARFDRIGQLVQGSTNTTTAINTPSILSAQRRTATTGTNGEGHININGTDRTTTPLIVDTTSYASSSYFIGASNAFGIFNGNMGDVIVYNRDLTASELDQVESYNAIKYGITLGQSPALQNYFDSRGNIVWNATANNGYNTNIIGLANDTRQALNQKVSKSTASGSILTIATDNDFALSNVDASRTTSLASEGYILVGESATGSYNFDQDYESVSNVRINKTWKVQKNPEATSGFYVALPNSMSFPTSNRFVVVSEDTTFDSSDVVVPLVDNGTHLSALITPNDGNYFTFIATPVLVELTSDASGAEPLNENLPKLLVKGTVSAVSTVTITDNGLGTANRPSDFAFVGGATVPQNLIVTIPVGEYDGTLATAVSIPTLAINDDGGIEGNETVKLNLNTPTGDVRIGDTNSDTSTIIDVTYTILDDETASKAEFTLNAISSADETTIPSFTKLLINGYLVVDKTIEIDVTTLGTATLGVDFTYNDPTVVTIPAGTYDGTLATAIDIPVPALINDTIQEGNETIVLDLKKVTTSTVELGDSDNNLFANTRLTFTISDDDGAPVTDFASSGSLVGESNPTVTIPVNVSTISGQNVTVPYTISSSSTASNSDYSDATTPTVGIVTIPAGSSFGSITLNINDDSISEGAESVIITLGVPNNATKGTTIQTHTLTINDDETLPNVNFNSAASTLSEGIGTFMIPVTLSNTTGSPVVVPLTLSGSASVGVDYTLPFASVTIPAGLTVANIPVTILNDTGDEADETLILTLGTPSNANLGSPNEYTLTITDDDNAPNVSFANISSAHSEAGNTISVTLNLSSVSNQAVQIPYTLSGGTTASGGIDFNFISSSPLTIPAGVTSTTLDITLLDDFVDEPNEKIIIDLGTPTNANLGTNKTHTATISDDDDTPEVSFVTSTFTTLESVGSHNLMVSLSNASSKNISVNYSLGGGATAGSDYLDIYAGTITIPAGSTGANLQFNLVDDLAFESNETLVATINSVTNAFKGTTDISTLTISDNDGTPEVSFTNGSSTKSEGSGTINIPVEINAISGQNVTVPVTVSGTSTANGNGTDYTLLTTTATIPAGTMSRNVQVTLSDDMLDEIDETIIVELGTPTNGILGSTTSHILTVTDNDNGPNVNIGAATSVQSEAGGVINIPVNLSTVSAQDVTITYSINGSSTATEDGLLTTNDFEDTTNNTITIPAGLTSGNIQITIHDDSTAGEGNESVILDLGTITNGTVGTITTHTMTIVENDGLPTVSFDTTSSTTVGTTEEGVTTRNIALTLSAVSATNVVIPYTIQAGSTATVTEDFSDTTNNSVTILAGNTTANIQITTVQDSIDESNETVILTLGIPNGAGLASPTTHTLTIGDDDSAPSVAFVNTTSTATEDTAGTRSIQVELSSPSASDVIIPYTITGTATQGTDFTNISNGVITIPSNSTGSTLQLGSVVDILDENNETVILELGTPSNANLGTNIIHTYTITDDDTAPTLSFQTSSSYQSELGGLVNIPLTLSTASALPVTVTYTVNGTSTATDPDDYANTSAGSVTIPAGVTTANLQLTITNDALSESNETIEITLDTPTNASLGSTTTHTTSITDDETNPTVSWTATSSTTAENNGTVVVTASISTPTANAITVPYTVNGTANNGTDFSTLGSFTIPANATIASTNIMLTDDTIDELSETIVLSLGLPSGTPVGGALGANTVHTITLTDDDATPNVSFQTTSSSPREADGVQTLTVNLSQASGLAITIPYTVNPSSTANIGSDATDTSGGQIVIPAGSTTADIQIMLNNDTLPEDTETLTLNLGVPTNATIGSNGSHTLTITDDDNYPDVYFLTPTTTPASGEGAGTVNIPVELSFAFINPVTVSYVLSGDALGVSDYTDATSTIGTITFNPGSTTGNISINLVDDGISEATLENLNIQLQTPTNAHLGLINYHTLVITDNDAGPVVSFSNGTSAHSEAGGVIQIPLTLSGSTTASITLPYSIHTSSTTTSGIDFTSTGVVVIPPGATSASIPLSLVNDTIYEGDETIVLDLGAPINAQWGTLLRHTATITDNDPLISVALSSTGQTVSENAGTLYIGIQLSSVSSTPVTLTYSLAGTANGVTDYTDTTTPTAGTISIPAGSLTGFIHLNILDDTLYEPAETLILNTQTASGAILSAPTSHTITLEDNDTYPNIGFDLASSTVQESDGNISLGVTLSSPSGSAVTIPVSIGSSSTTNSLDRALSTTLLTIPAGSTTGSISVNITDDSLDENDETFVVELGTPTGANLVGNINHTLTITDNDANPTVAFIQTDSTLSEASGTGTIVVALSNVSAKDVNIPYTIASNSTTVLSSDYTTISSGTVTIPAGAMNIPIQVSLLDDTQSELSETIVFELGTPTNATLGINGTHTLTITDNDGPGLVAAVITTTHGVEDLSPTDAIVTVTLSGINNTGSPIVFDTSVTGGTATVNDDYTDTTGIGTISIPNGSQSATLSLPVLNDSIEESSETIEVTLSNPSTSLVSIFIPTTTVTIADDDASAVAVTAQLSVTDGTENNTGSPTPLIAKVTLSENNATGAPITFNIGITHGTATSLDYTDTAGVGVISIPHGSSSGTLSIPVLEDGIVEPSENIHITLSSPSHPSVVILTGTATGTIISDDILPISPVILGPTNGNPVLGSSNPNTTITLSTPSGASCTTTTDSSGKYTCVLTPVPVQGESITATSTDIYGNTSTPTTLSGGIELVNPDIDGDGIPNRVDPDMDGDGVSNTMDTDTDGDGIPNTTDTDDDNDGISDITDSAPNGSIPSDVDGDGILNELDLDIDGDGTPNATDTDIDGDGILDDVDIDVDGDGVLNDIDSDIDGDGIPNNQDSDMDGDGVLNTTDIDTDGDGTPNTTDTDDDNDGILDTTDTSPNGALPGDIDADGILDALDTDIDGDGILDAVDTDVDGDGISNGVDNDIDGDGILNNQDPDMDGDGIMNNIDIDVDGDGTPNTTDTDDDNDGILDTSDSSPLGTLSNDADQDGNLDTIENAGFNAGDGNGDGIQDSQQINVAGTPNPITGQYSTLEASGSCQIVDDFDIITENTQSSQDSLYDYPLGLGNFTLNCSSPGGTGSVTIYYDRVYDTSRWEWRKYNSVTGQYANVADIVSVSISNHPIGSTQVTKVTFTVKDGDTRVDEDGLTNGQIVDPVGPAVPINYPNSSDGGGSGGGSGGGGSSTSVPNSSTSVVSLPVVVDTPKEEILPQKQEIIEKQEVVVEKDKNMSGEVKEYTLANSFDSCTTINNILNPGFRFEYKTQFYDIGKGILAKKIIQMEKVGVVSGIGEGRFAPLKDISRAEFLKILLRSHCYEYRTTNTDNTPFIDVEKGSWQSQVAETARQLDMISGDKDASGQVIFRPNDPISKAEALKMLINMAHLKVDKNISSTYFDIQGTWYENYVKKGEYLKILDPEGEYYSFNGNASVSRGNMVQLISNLLRLYR